MKVKKTFENLTLEGESIKNKDGSIVITGKLSGSVKVECVKCLKEFDKKIEIIPRPEGSIIKVG